MKNNLRFFVGSFFGIDCLIKYNCLEREMDEVYLV